MLRLRRLIGLPVVLALAPAWAAAQAGSATISGHVTSESGQPLANASVVLRGTGFGTLTKDDGQFSFTIPATRVTGQTATLTARLIGYKASTATITLSAGTITHDFVLESNPVQLQGVVVTALAIQKQKSQLGTAVQQLSSEELNATHDQNIVNQLEGKVSGVTINASGTQGGSTNIVIRGANSITGDNTPLFVVDGIPVSNRDRGGHPMGGNAQSGGWDFGSAISDINPDDIASITILKGPNAAALYGSRAANGAIIITTKNGGRTDGKIETRLTTSYTWDKVGILPDYQNQYGQGSAGQFSYVDGNGGGVQDYNDQSYGPKLDGRLVDQFTGAQQPWVAHPNNVESFFNTGHTYDVNLAASGGTDRANARLAVGAQNVSGIIPNNFFQRFTGSLAGDLKVGRHLSTNASLNFIRNNGENRPGVGYSNGILEQFVWFGRQVDMNALRAHWNDYDANGRHFNWNQSYHSNPFWLQYANPERDTRNRFIGTVSARYAFTDWLNATLRTGSDIYNMSIDQDFGPDNVSWSGLSDPSYNGGFSLFNNASHENNTDVLVSATRQVASRLGVSATVGAAKRYTTYNSTQQQTTGILVPGIYNVSNAAVTPTLNQYSERLQLNSVYGSASFTWNDWWTVEGTARNDWSSTLPKGNNSYFYPSVNTSVVLTDAIPSLKSRVLSYMKVRGSLARVGNSATPYQLRTTFVGDSRKFGGLPLYSLGDTLANANLKPEITKSGEVGLELGFFGDRASLDATYYEKSTTNQIINITVSSAAGFSRQAVNAGDITNKGFEALLNVTPIRTRSGFEWNTTFSYSHNRSEVARLAPGIQTVVLGSAWYINVEARRGESYGALYGNSFLRDSATGQLLLENGLPQVGPQKVLGNVQPDWTGGWNNEFRYKHATLSFLFDIHQGGDIFSITNMWGTYSGVFASTLHGREKDWDAPGIVARGIDQATGQPNTTSVTAEQYYQSLGNNFIHEAFVYDDSWIKLREVRLAYDLPSSLVSRMRAQAVTLAFIGRNLWTHTNVPNIDPEFSYSTGNFQGVEYATIPNPKSFGINLQVTP